MELHTFVHINNSYTAENLHFLQNKNEITLTGHFIHTQAMFTEFSHQFDF